MVSREDVPVDIAHVNELVESILSEEKLGRNSGQLSPVLLGEVPGQPQLKILDGFHRVSALYSLNRDQVFATIRPECTEETVVDLRIIAATTHRAVRFVRLLEWVEDAWRLGPWGERIKISQALGLRFQRTMTGKNLGLESSEADEIKDWIERKSQQWHISPGTLYQHFLTAQHADPALVREARGREGGHKLEALTPDHLAAIARVLPDKHVLQQLVAEETTKRNLTIPRARALAEVVAEVGSVEEARIIMGSIKFNVADQAIQPAQSAREQSPFFPVARQPEVGQTHERRVFLQYYGSAQLRAYEKGISIFEIIGTDFAVEIAGNSSLQPGGSASQENQNGKDEPEHPEYITFTSPFGELVLYPDRAIVDSPLQPKGMLAELTPTEAIFLGQLMKRPTMVHTPAMLVSALGDHNDMSWDIVKTHISHLRSKLGDISRGKEARHKLIFNLSNRGYTLIPNPLGVGGGNISLYDDQVGFVAPGSQDLNTD